MYRADVNILEIKFIELGVEGREKKNVILIKWRKNGFGIQTGDVNKKTFPKYSTRSQIIWATPSHRFRSIDAITLGRLSSHSSQTIEKLAVCLPGCSPFVPFLFSSAATGSATFPLGNTRSHLAIPSNSNPIRTAALREAAFSAWVRHSTRRSPKPPAEGGLSVHRSMSPMAFVATCVRWNDGKIITPISVTAFTGLVVFKDRMPAELLCLFSFPPAVTLSKIAYKQSPGELPKLLSALS